MDKTTNDIKSELTRFIAKDAVITTATVVSVDEGNATVTAKLSSGLELDDIRLRSVIKEGNRCVIIPAAGTTILIGQIEQDPEFVVLAMEAIEKVLYVFGDVKFEVSEYGFLIKKENDTLQSILNDLIAQIKLIVVPTNSGPSGNPLNAPAFEEINERVNNILNAS